MRGALFQRINLTGHGDQCRVPKKNKRTPQACPVCSRIKPLTKHHLVPLADDGELKALAHPDDPRTIRICSECHDLAHFTWGPGNDYRGPVAVAEFVPKLRRVRSKKR